MGNPFAKWRQGWEQMKSGNPTDAWNTWYGKGGFYSELDPTDPNSYVSKHDPYRDRSAEDIKANKAAEAAANRQLDKAAGIQQQTVKQQMQQTKPWQQAGQQALQQYQSLDYSPEKFDFSNLDLYNDPSYKFRLQQGVEALDRSAAARGKVLSGQQQQAIANYGQNLASQEYANAFNRAMQANQLNNAYNRQYFGDKLGQYGNLMGYGYNATGQNINALGGYGNALANIYGRKANINYQTPLLGKADKRYYNDRVANFQQAQIQNGINMAAGAMGMGGNALSALV